MADSLSQYLAGEIVDWLANATQLDTPPGTLYVSVLDDTNADLNASFPNAPVGVGSADWNRSGTQFENGVNVNLGEATQDLNNIEDIVIYDGSDPGTDNELLRTPITDGPFDVTDGTQVVFESGDITYDAVESTA
jgi:hypothetical protein